MKNRVIICPGGGYRLLGDNEGEPVARRFAERGYDASVLNYTVGDGVIFTQAGFADFKPACELRGAISASRKKLDSNAGHIILAGFSAGGHLAAGYCLANSMKPGADLPMPDALLLSYPMLSLGSSYGVDSRTRDAFDIPRSIKKYGLPERAKNLSIYIWHSTADKMIPFESSVSFVKILGDAGAHAHFTKFDEGRHGDPSTTPGWFEAAMEYLYRGQNLYEDVKEFA
jgi:acetyl esterase/lipase